MTSVPSRSKPGPERTCLGCGARFAKSGLLRFVVRGGALTVDSAKSLSGRGVYCCRSVTCLNKFASKKGRLARVLRAEVTDCQSALGIINKVSG